jgi:hypothetical protein
MPGKGHGRWLASDTAIPGADGQRIFGLRMPDQQVLHSTVFRCAEGHVLVCSYGANLPRGKANSDRDLRWTPFVRQSEPLVKV